MISFNMWGRPAAGVKNCGGFSSKCVLSPPILALRAFTNLLPTTCCIKHINGPKFQHIKHVSYSHRFNPSFSVPSAASGGSGGADGPPGGRVKPSSGDGGEEGRPPNAWQSTLRSVLASAWTKAAAAIIVAAGRSAKANSAWVCRHPSR